MGEALNEPLRRKRASAWKVLGIVAASLFGALILVYLWISAIGSRRFREMGLTVDAMIVETRARDSSRPVLRGTAVPGNAWTDYEPALKETAGMRADREALVQFVERSPKADRARVERILAAHPTVIEQLRKGAARGSGQFPYRWEDGFTAKTPGIQDSQILVHLVVVQSRLGVEAGKSREAIELLLDCCQFARDTGHNATLLSAMISMAHYGAAFDGLRGLLGTPGLSREDLAELERELEIVDRWFPSMEIDFQNEAMVVGCALRKEDLQGLDDLRLLRAFDGPRRLIYADAFDKHCFFMRRSGASESKPWPEALRIQGELQKELEKLWNPITRTMVPGMHGAGRAVRERRAQLRLLRVATRYRATGDILSLDDPLGVRLGSSLTGTRLKVWSAGRNGVDEGGSGDWKPGLSSADIVLEVDR